MSGALPKAPQDDAKTEDKPKSSLFNFSQPSGEKKEEDKKDSLFGSKVNSTSLFSNNTGNNIFGKTTSACPLFGGSGTSKPLFGNGGSSLFGPKKEGEEKSTLFGNQPQGKSLFDNKNSLFGNQTNIFSKSGDKTNNEKEADKKSQDGDDSGNEYKNEEEPPTVTLKEYVGPKSPYEKIIEFQV